MHTLHNSFFCSEFFLSLRLRASLKQLENNKYYLESKLTYFVLSFEVEYQAFFLFLLTAFLSLVYSLLHICMCRHEAVNISSLLSLWPAAMEREALEIVLEWREKKDCHTSFLSGGTLRGNLTHWLPFAISSLLF